MYVQARETVFFHCDLGVPLPAASGRTLSIVSAAAILPELALPMNKE